MVKKGGEGENQYISILVANTKKPPSKGLGGIIIEQGTIVDLTQKPNRSGIIEIGASNRAYNILANQQDNVNIFPGSQKVGKLPRKEGNRYIHVGTKTIR